MSPQLIKHKNYDKVLKMSDKSRVKIPKIPFFFKSPVFK